MCVISSWGRNSRILFSIATGSEKPPDPVHGPKERVLLLKNGPAGERWKLVQMEEHHVPSCMDIQASCFDPSLREEKDAYLDRLRIHPQGMVMIMVPSEADPAAWEIAGYTLFQPFFKGELLHDGDTEMLSKACSGEHKVDCLYTHELSISPKFRGKGLTEPLRAFVEGQARTMGLEWCTLVAVPSAHKFWSRCGYQTLRKEDYQGEPCYYMEKRIWPHTPSSL